MRYKKIGYYDENGEEKYYTEDLKSYITPALFLSDEKTKEHTFDRWHERQGDKYRNFENYCINFEKARNQGIGFILSGECGTGKTYVADCIYNALKDKYLVCKSSLATMLNLITKDFGNAKPYKINNLIDDLLRLDLIIFDDLGNEKIENEWIKGLVFDIFDTLYRNKIPFVITTNLNSNQLKEHLKIKDSLKIYDRIREVCKGYNYNNLKNMRYNKNNRNFEEIF